MDQNSNSNEKKSSSKKSKHSIFSLGYLSAAILAVVFVYFAWGAFFKPGGTGSNVLLALLLGFAAIYFIAMQLGPFLNEILFGYQDQLLQVESQKILTNLNALISDKSKKGIDVAQEEILRDKLVMALENTSAESKKLLQSVYDEVFLYLKSEDKKKGFMASFGSLGFALLLALIIRSFVVVPFQIPSGSMIPTLLVGDHLFVSNYTYGLRIPFVETPKYFIRWDTPKTGEVIVFTAPPSVKENAGEAWIKRVIATEGQKVKIRENTVYIDDVAYPQKVSPTSEIYKDFYGFMNSWGKRTAYLLDEEINGKTHQSYLEPNSILNPQKWPSPKDQGHLKGLHCDLDACTVDKGHVFVMGDNRDNSADGRMWGAVPLDNVQGRAMMVWMSVDGSGNSIKLGRFILPKFRWNRFFQSIE